MNEAEWKAFGDVNPMEHGGVWVMSDEEKNGEAFKGCYYLLKFNPDAMEITDVYVDVDSDWIDKKAVMDYIGMSEEDYDEIQYVIGCSDYYNHLEFQGECTQVNSIKQASEFLGSRGVSI